MRKLLLLALSATMLTGCYQGIDEDAEQKSEQTKTFHFTIKGDWAELTRARIVHHRRDTIGIHRHHADIVGNHSGRRTATQHIDHLPRQYVRRSRGIDNHTIGTMERPNRRRYMVRPDIVVHDVEAHPICTSQTTTHPDDDQTVEFTFRTTLSTKWRD